MKSKKDVTMSASGLTMAMLHLFGVMVILRQSFLILKHSMLLRLPISQWVQV